MNIGRVNPYSISAAGNHVYVERCRPVDGLLCEGRVRSFSS